MSVGVFDSGGSRLDSNERSASGDRASGTDEFEFKHRDGSSFSVRLRVTDEAGAATEAERTVDA
ncbi:hypothetical protein [Haloarcula salinisoli]|uniref:Uncharacterized protein n=1 Tax=Haloarcula salinisoli TaxID=2487746 RepID=A0A8J7YLE1_9EURY|nr:hypothetical protein [Halomicroarcula salinisoli]MBX0285200.1 hypothetical protein [Halomicroarcula salinisoli]MBX0303323.1 hypothetical protein [Halomicroarcula salinisoli]